MTRLKIEDLSVRYHHISVLKHVSFSIHEQEMVAVLGRNGCGKTTLLKAIAGSLESSGHIYVDDHDLHSLSIKQRARLISFLTQRFHVIEGITVKELIGFGQYSYYQQIHREGLNDMIIKVAKALHLYQFLEKDYVTLSEGQKQMVQLAKTLVQNTPVILLDEPDSALDFDNRHFLYCYLQKMIKAENKSALVVLHDPVYALNYCDRIILIDQGQIVDVINTNESLAQINFKLQKIYPDLTVEKQPQINQFYTLFKESI